VADVVELLFNLTAKDGVSVKLKKVGDEAEKMGLKFNASATLSTLKMVGMTVAIGGAVAESVALVDAATPVLGLLAEMPALAVGAAAGIGTLLVGFSGISAALQTTAAQSAQAADQMVQAQHRVAQAQQQATQASKDLAEARRQEANSDRDLALQLKEANIGVAEAQLGVRDAQKELNDARKQGDPLAVAHATLALQEAQLRVAEATNKATDTQYEYNKRQQQGVGNSDQVKQAINQQAEATFELGEAQKALKTVGASAAATAYARLAPAAKAVVDQLRAFIPAWRGVQQSVQQRLFAGLADDVRALGQTYLPVLESGLGPIATAWNRAFDQTAKLLGTKRAVDGVNSVLSATAKFGQQAGQALAPFADAFGQFVSVGSQYLPGLGLWIHKIADDLDRWASNANQTGKINKWINDGISAASQLWAIFKTIGGAVVDIFKAGDAGPKFLQTVLAGVQAFKAWVDSAKGQAALHAIFKTFRQDFELLLGVVGTVAQVIGGVASSGGLGMLAFYLQLAGDAAKWLSDHQEIVNALLPIAMAAFLGYRLIVQPLIGILQLVAGAMDLVDLAMDANPIGLVVLAIGALVAGFLLLWFNCKPFRDFWINLWKENVKAVQEAWHFIEPVFHWIADKFTWLKDNIDWGAIWHGMTAAFKVEMNALITLLNTFISAFDTGTIGVLNGASGVLGIPKIPRIPEIPHLAVGGTVLRTGVAVIHKGEVVQPAKVSTPYTGGGGGNGQVDVHIHFDGPAPRGELEAAVLKWLRGTIRATSGTGTTSVQKALGWSS
jgi:hypothetical protein